jgi:hypothetical protein
VALVLLIVWAIDRVAAMTGTAPKLINTTNQPLRLPPILDGIPSG